MGPFTHNLRGLIVLTLLGWSGMSIITDVSGQVRNEYDVLRKKMVEDYLLTAGVNEERVLKAILSTPRHEFVPPAVRARAYFDMALPIGDNQTISSPYIVAYMTQALATRDSDKVLEIGTGSGYQAAVLSPLVKDVYTIEIVEELGKKSTKLLQKLGYKNVHVKLGDGFQGWAEHAPFDKIIVTCSPEKVPQPLIDQLADGGLMVVPVGERYQQTLYLYRKKEGKLESEALLPTLFVPMTGKAEQSREKQPDPAHPALVNGGFEEEAFPSGAQPGWYYERQVSWEPQANSNEQAPAGKHFIKIKNEEPGLPAHLLQGFAIDGRKVTHLQFSAKVKYANLVWGKGLEARPSIVVSLYDELRRELGHHVIGPFDGTADWALKSKVIAVPKATREGIFRIGLYGATGSISFDEVEIKRIDSEK
jgi:protein-L-isoaspartate(D-aspartate) O-methyltransferase